MQSLKHLYTISKASRSIALCFLNKMKKVSCKSDTQRYDSPMSSQWLAVLKPESWVMDIDNISFYIGSCVNALSSHRKWFVHVNCASAEVTINSNSATHVFNLNLCDNNDASLSEYHDVIDKISGTLKNEMLGPNTMNVLFNCFVGASRSVAVLICVVVHLLHSLENKSCDAKEDPEDMFERFYNQIKTHRSSVCISEQLRQEVISYIRFLRTKSEKTKKNDTLYKTTA